MRKKCMILLFIMMLTVCEPINIFASNNENAAESEEEIDVVENVEEYRYGVSDVPPDGGQNEGISTYSTGKPTTTWNIKDSGEYSFSGNSNHQTLYTNYYFTGKTKYKVKVKNTGSKAITVYARRKGLISTKTYAMLRVGKGKTTTFNVTDIKKTTEFYLEFNGGGNSYQFSGSVN